MLTIKCKTNDTLLLKELAPFQGELKKRSSEEITKMAESISSDGLLMPFVVWRHDNINHLLDGHGRLLAITGMLMQDSSIAEQQFPVLYVNAEDESEARKALLQITSQYGKITRKGIQSFCASIPTYTAPCVVKFQKKAVKHRAHAAQDDEVTLKIAVQRNQLEAVKQILSEVSYIRLM